MRLGKLLGLALLLPAGCLSVPPADNPLIFRPGVNDCENPVTVRPGAPSAGAYADVFEKTLSVLTDYFDIAYANRYDGRIICQPKYAPGLERCFVNGTPDLYQRLYATFQTIRYRCYVQIRAAEQGGYQVQVTIYRELQDMSKPMGTQSGSVFRDQMTVDRQFQVVDPEVSVEVAWIPKGRETALEDAILCKIRRCQYE